MNPRELSAIALWQRVTRTLITAGELMINLPLSRFHWLEPVWDSRGAASLSVGTTEASRHR
ncbi:MAG: hypothetical protein WKF55_07540 [Gemmatimonadaceae bacterium]